jgi:hypothetical protein
MLDTIIEVSPFRGGVTGVWGCCAREGAVSPIPKAPTKK